MRFPIGLSHLQYISYFNKYKKQMIDNYTFKSQLISVEKIQFIYVIRSKKYTTVRLKS